MTENQVGDTSSLMKDNPLSVRGTLGDVLQKQFIFIIGSDRSGTTWLQSMLGAHPQVATTVQLTLFHTYVPDWVRSWKLECEYIEDENQWDMGLPIVWSEDEFVDFLREFISRVYARVAERFPDATHLLDKHPAYRHHVEEINMLIPHARFIHVIRDGRDVAVSLKAAKKGLGWGFSSISDAAVHWKQFVEAGKQAAKYGDRYMELRYEDLGDEGEQTMRNVFDFCDLPSGDEEIADIVERHRFSEMKSKRSSPDPNRSAPADHYRRGKAGGWRDELKPLEQYFFHLYAGGLLEQLGYAESQWWYKSSLQKVRLQTMGNVYRTARRLRRAWQVLVNG